MPETEKFHIYQFDEYLIDTVEETLRRNGEKVIINRRTFQVLRLLVERAGQIVTKQEFFDTVWADAFVQDNSLTVTMTTLRKALGDDAKQARFIENLPRKGYRFIGEVKTLGDEPPIAQVEEKSIIAPTADVEKRNIIAPTAGVGKKTIFRNRNILFGISAACLMVLLFVLGFNYFGFSRLRGSSASALQIESVAVLPFENQNPDTEYISDGLTESVINNLSALSNLRVISRNSAFQYKNKPTDSMTVGRELNVNAVLTGRFSQRGDDLTINAELTDARDSRQIWGRQYFRKASDEFALRQEMARDITEALRSKLTGEERQRLERRETDSPEAFHLYLKGRYYWNKRTEADFEKAIDFFNQAIEKDPTYALAYVGLANCYVLENSGRITHDERWAMVEAAAQKALEIDENLGEAYTVLAINDGFHKWDRTNAEKKYRRAIELNPNYATARHWYAEFLAIEARFDESFAEYNRAIELDPLSLAIKTDLGISYFYARQPDRAIEYLQNLKKINPNYPRTYFFLMQAYEEKGMFEEAIEEHNNFFAVQGENLHKQVSEKAALVDAVKTSGAKGYWQKKLDINFDEQISGPFGKAMLYARLNDRDKTFEYLEKAFAVRDAAISYLKIRPEFDNIRSDPRFADLVRRVGLPQ
jgi:DNA-binding winged helix-turn-helix (wHTH) protein/TolB-like protein/Tfp pilus assembly protein PilF